MIDEDFRVWLIEINSNPYIGTPNKFTKELVPKMIDEMLQIVLDVHYPPDLNYQPLATSETCQFELIYKELQSYHAPNIKDSSYKSSLSPYRHTSEFQIVN